MKYKHKKCSRCLKVYSTKLFRRNKSKSDCLDSWCKFCSYAYHIEWRKKNHDKWRFSQQKYRKKHSKELVRKTTKYRKDHSEWYRKVHRKYQRKNKSHLKDLRLRREYGITLSDYTILLKQQKYRCKICLRKTVLYVDHDHRTKLVRGLLCCNCNHAIGLFYENLFVLNSAIKYLKNDYKKTNTRKFSGA